MYAYKRLALVLVILSGVLTNGCEKDSPNIPSPPPLAKPTLTITATATQLEYEDGAGTVITVNSTNATSVTYPGQPPGPDATTLSIKLEHLIKDVTMTFTAKGFGGEVTQDFTIKVNPISEMGKLVVGDWQLYRVTAFGESATNPVFQWRDLPFDDCLARMVHTFALNKVYTNDHACTPGFPQGLAWWSFQKSADGRLQFNRGGDINYIYNLTATEFEMGKEVSMADIVAGSIARSGRFFYKKIK